MMMKKMTKTMMFMMLKVAKDGILAPPNAGSRLSAVGRRKSKQTPHLYQALGGQVTIPLAHHLQRERERVCKSV